jgi:glucose dehydrogenase
MNPPFHIPMGHFGGPVDVAFGALYLASAESKYVTGIELTINGGILAGSQARPKRKQAREKSRAYCCYIWQIP